MGMLLPNWPQEIWGFQLNWKLNGSANNFLTSLMVRNRAPPKCSTSWPRSVPCNTSLP